MNSAITEFKNILEGTNRRVTEAEEWISEMENRMVEITETEQNKEKKNKSDEDSLRDCLTDSIKHNNIRIIGIPEEENKRKGQGKIFKEVIVGSFNFPKMRGEIATQPHKAQTVPYNINPRRNMTRHILIKLTKIKHKEQMLKAAREKQQIT